MTDIESRMGIRPIEELLAERAAKVAEAAPLWARHGAGDWANHQRKSLLSAIETKIRAQAVADGVKTTEASIEQLGHADQAYMDFLTETITDRERLFVLEHEIAAIDAQINRGQALARFAAAEARL